MSIDEPGLLTRARHTEVSDASWAQGAVTHQTAAYDAVGHTAGLMRAHTQALHGSGVALGLDVRLAPAEHGVVIVGAGFAVDALGQHIALVPGAFAEVAPDARGPDGKRQSATVEDDGVRLPIPSVTAELVVAIKHFERAEKVGELAVLRHTPWLGWVAETDLAPDGPYVPLAKITVVNGNATAITAGPRAAIFTMTGALSLTETSVDGGVSDQVGASIVLDQGSLLIDKAGAGGTLRLGARDAATRASLPLDRIDLAAKETHVQDLRLDGAITPSVGNTDAHGVRFPSNPGGGSGDAAFIRYHAEAGEATTLRVGIDNDADDTLRLWQQGADRLIVHDGLVTVGSAPYRGGAARALNVGDEVKSFGARAGMRLEDRTALGNTSREWVVYVHDTRLWFWSGTSNDVMSITPDGELNIASTIRAPGRMHLASGELMYLLPKSGVIIGKEWGGNGDLRVEGEATVDGRVNANAGYLLGGRVVMPHPNGGTLQINWGAPYSIVAVQGCRRRWPRPRRSRRCRPTPADDHAALGRRYMSSPLARCMRPGARIVEPMFSSPSGRMHLASGELMYLLPKSGVIIGKEWGGNGDLRVEGEATVDGRVNANAGYLLGGKVVMHPNGGTLQINWGAPYSIVAVQGLLRVDGTFQVNGGSKNFCIPHPLAPAEKQLVHACIEGPEAAVYYRGEGRLTAGSATVRLPEYFEALTRREGRTVQITPIGAPGEPVSALCASRVVEGRFTVSAFDARNPSQEFYWEVKAVRADIAALVIEPTPA